MAAPQLVEKGALDYLVFDYLAETTMAVLPGARAKRSEPGYATDFVDIAMKAVLPEVMRQSIKVVANAGGIHPQGCADALRALADSLGLKPRIAVLLGDDVRSIGNSNALFKPTGSGVNPTAPLDPSVSAHQEPHLFDGEDAVFRTEVPRSDCCGPVFQRSDEEVRLLGRPAGRPSRRGRRSERGADGVLRLMPPAAQADAPERSRWRRAASAIRRRLGA